MKICYTGGGTLGSVTPLLAIRSHLPEIKAFWIGTEHGVEEEYVRKADIPFYGIHAYKLRRYMSLKTITELPQLVHSYRVVKAILSQNKPDLVITAGGFTGVPVARAAASLNIPYAILQLDLQVGLANKIIYKKASIVFVSTETLMRSFTHPHVYACGIPIEKNVIDAFANIKQTQSGLPTVLFFGGGTGSRWINEYIASEGAEILKFANVLHVQGNADRAIAVHSQKAEGTYVAKTSIQRIEMARLYASADLIVCRAGMGTCAELSRFKKPSIIIPMPNTHQEHNALFFSTKNASVTHTQGDGQKALTKKISDVLSDATLLQQLKEQIGHALPSHPEACIEKHIRAILNYND